VNRGGQSGTENAAVPLLAESGPGVWRERVVRFGLAACAGISALVTVGIIVVLLSEAAGFFRQVSLMEFLTDTQWSPLFGDRHFGVLPLLVASLQVAIGAGLLALPTGLLTAVFLSEYSSPGLRSVLKPTLEILAGIPTVVYGYFALTFVTPALRWFFPGSEVFNGASAAIVLGIMILPTVSSLSEDAIRSVPRGLRDAAYGLGASKLAVTTRIVVPAGASGILASFILALSRALGETMVVTIAAGNSPQLTVNPLEAIQTMTAYIVQVGLGDTSSGTLEHRTLFAVGMALFLITFGMNWTAQWVRSRKRGGRVA
jgi:phosphate transport system permease protein